MPPEMQHLRSGTLVTQWLHIVYDSRSGEIVHLHHQMQIPGSDPKQPHRPEQVLSLVPKQISNKDLATFPIPPDEAVRRKPSEFHVDIPAKRVVRRKL
jgi:hypothetical protein